MRGSNLNSCGTGCAESEDCKVHCREGGLLFFIHSLQSWQKQVREIGRANKRSTGSSELRLWQPKYSPGQAQIRQSLGQRHCMVVTGPSIMICCQVSLAIHTCTHPLLTFSGGFWHVPHLLGNQIPEHEIIYIRQSLGATGNLFKWPFLTPSPCQQGWHMQAQYFCVFSWCLRPMM